MSFRVDYASRVQPRFNAIFNQYLRQLQKLISDPTLGPATKTIKQKMEMLSSTPLWDVFSQNHALEVKPTETEWSTFVLPFLWHHIFSLLHNPQQTGPYLMPFPISEPVPVNPRLHKVLSPFFGEAGWPSLVDSAAKLFLSQPAQPTITVVEHAIVKILKTLKKTTGSVKCHTILTNIGYAALYLKMLRMGILDFPPKAHEFHTILSQHGVTLDHTSLDLNDYAPAKLKTPLLLCGAMSILVLLRTQDLYSFSCSKEHMMQLYAFNSSQRPESLVKVETSLWQGLIQVADGEASPQEMLQKFFVTISPSPSNFSKSIPPSAMKYFHFGSLAVSDSCEPESNITSTTLRTAFNAHFPNSQSILTKPSATNHCRPAVKPPPPPASSRSQGMETDETTSASKGKGKAKEMTPPSNSPSTESTTNAQTSPAASPEPENPDTDVPMEPHTQQEPENPDTDVPMEPPTQQEPENPDTDVPMEPPTQQDPIPAQPTPAASP
ncbi:hypothetical protein EV361DRAFT_956623, partial [Lentinula raphanica]